MKESMIAVRKREDSERRSKDQQQKVEVDSKRRSTAVEEAKGQDGNHAVDSLDALEGGGEGSQVRRLVRG